MRILLLGEYVAEGEARKEEKRGSANRGFNDVKSRRELQRGVKDPQRGEKKTAKRGDHIQTGYQKILPKSILDSR